ncbi:MAG: hypothetical protein WD077_00185 [Bacteroidia bacterium]
MKHSRFQLYIIFLVIIHLVVLVFSAYRGHHILKDSEEYLLQAENLKGHSSWYAGTWDEERRPELHTRRTPGYGLLLYLSGTTADHPFPVLIIQTVLSFVTFLWLGMLLSRAELPLYPVVIGVLLFPSQFIYTQLIMSEILFQFMLWASFASFWIWRHQGKYWQYFLFHIFIALSIAVKPVMLYFWIIALLISVILAIKKRKLVLIIPACIPFAMVLLISGINQRNTGFFHFSSMQYTNMLSYNAHHILIQTEGEERAEEITDSLLTEAGKFTEYAERAAFLQKKGVAIIFGSPLVYAKFHLKGMANFFLDPGRFDFQAFFYGENRDEPGMYYYFSREGYAGIISYWQQLPGWQSLLLVFILGWNVLLAVSFLLFLIQPNQDPWLKWLLVVFVLYICFLTGPVGAARFKVPVYPFLLFTVPFLLQFIKTKLSR